MNETNISDLSDFLIQLGPLDRVIAALDSCILDLENPEKEASHRKPMNEQVLGLES